MRRAAGAGSPPHRRAPAVPALLVVLLAACAPSAEPAAPSPVASDLRSPAPGPPAESASPACRHLPAPAAGAPPRPVELAAGACDEVLVDAAAGDLLDLRVDQRGVDVVVRLFDPAGRQLVEVDTPFADWGEEVVRIVAAAAGAHQLRVEAFGDDAGTYALASATRRPAADADRASAAAHAILHAADSARYAGRGDEAAAGFEEVRRRAEALADSFLAGEADHRMALLAVRARDWRRAEALAAGAAESYAAAGAVPRRAVALTTRGSILFEAGRLAAARDAFSEALRLYRRSLPGDVAGTAQVLHNLGHAWQLDGYPQQAMEAYAKAIRFAIAAGDAGGEAQSRHNLGVLLLSLGRTDAATTELSEAAERWEEAGDAAQAAVALDKLGVVLLLRGDPGTVSHLRRVLARRDHRAGRTGWAVTASQLGLAWWRRGEPLAGAAAYRCALASLGAPLDPGEGDAGGRQPGATELRVEAVTQRNLAALESALGASREAAERQRRALALYRQLEDSAGRAAVLADLAVSHRRLGDPEGALELAYEALDLFESHRTRPDDPALRTDWFATVQQHYESTVDLLFELHRSDAAAGHDAAAFLVAERSRARTLLDLRSGTGDEAASPPPPLGAAEVRRRLATPGTAVLAYKLGEEASHLWLLDADGLATWKLPPRRVLEAVAERARRLLALSHRGEGRRGAASAACEASRRLLSPAAARLAGARRLVVVGDGAVAALPFAALPEPGVECSRAAPLVARRVVTQPPSATLAALRARAGSGTEGTVAATRIAVFADPVYAASDPRLGDRAASTEDGTAAPRRLAGSAREAAAVAAAAGAASNAAGVDLHLGFEARPAAVAAAAASHHVIHLAVHGVADQVRPEESALLLSRWDARGRPLDGDLTAAEVLELDLGADLVVLSACRTALGKQVRGEGMLGIGRAFLAAGAGRVLVSLWDVGDAASAELMGRFYHHLLAAGLEPAAALAAAQRELAAAGRPPAQWAGFVVQG